MLTIEPAPLPDEQLMLRVQSGDRRAYEELYSRWRVPLFRFLLRRTCSRQHAEDALQEVWMRIYKYRRSYNTGRPFRGWVYAIALNAGRDAPRPEVEGVFLSPERMLGGDTRDLIQARDRVMRTLHALSGVDRRLILLTGEGFTSREIAEMMTMPDSTVRTRIQRARVAAKKVLNES